MQSETKMKRKSTTATYFTFNGNGDEQQEDRLSSLPDVLLIYIFSSIDTKLAVQASILSKRWVNLWTLLPVLNFDSSPFESSNFYNWRSKLRSKSLCKSAFKITFDMFIDKVLACRNRSIKIDGVNIKVTDYETLARVFNIALSHRVPNLSIDSSGYLTNLSIDSSEYLTTYPPISCLNSSNSLIVLTLKGMIDFGRFPSFSGLVSLRLERVRIVESEPFSCFPNLKELYLVNCKLPFELKVLEVVGFQLLKLKISSCFHNPRKKLVLSTPKLVLLELDGLVPMSFEAFELPDLDTVHLDCCFSLDKDQEEDNLIKILWCIRNAKCVHLSPSTLEIFPLSHGKLVEEPSPFVNLKVLKLIPPPNKPVGELHSFVATYFLKGSPTAVVRSFPW